MGATTTTRQPHLTSKDIKATLNKFKSSPGQDWGYDVFYCPIDLLGYIADITVLYKKQHSRRKMSRDSVQKATSLGTTLKAWEQSTFESKFDRHVVEVWRNGILLYLVRIFRLAHDVFDTPSLICTIFHHARAIPVRKSYYVSTTWPLFQAGLLLSREDQEAKSWLRNELLTSFHTLGCFNLYRAVEVLEKVWGMDDEKSHDFFTFELVNCNLILL